MIKKNIKSFSYVCIICFVFINSIFSFSQSTDQNYINVKTMIDESASNYIDKIIYHDGFGRVSQIVIRNFTPSRNADHIILQEYDLGGRPNKKWLTTPITVNGQYTQPTMIQANAKSFYNDVSPYDNVKYGNSTIDRIVEISGAGNNWEKNNRSKNIQYQRNSSAPSFQCSKFIVTADKKIQKKGSYVDNSLYITINIDEDRKKIMTFYNNINQILLERKVDEDIFYDTYYVYDDFGNLRFLLPPAASDALTAINVTWDISSDQILKDYAYYYQYDGKNNCTLKKLPGCNDIEMRYDMSGRLIFSKDGEQHSRNEWSFFFYDVFGRQTVSGLWVSSSVPDITNTVVKTNCDIAGTNLGGYTVNLTLPATIKLMTINYYDNYGFLDISMNAKKDSLVFRDKGYDPQHTNTKGLTTGSRTFLLNDPTKYTVTAIYYDYRERIVQIRTSNNLGGYDNEYFKYTFTGKVKQRMLVHSATGKNTLVETYYYNYGTPATNPAERLLDVKHKISPNSSQTTLTVYTYDDIGRVKTKKLATETSNYNYNVRSWLIQISCSKFNQTLTYESSINGVTPTTPVYNGNISAMKWKSGDETTERGYKFAYDGLDRLSAATYGEGTGITANLNRFNEAVTYNDKMGNIKTLQRQGKVTASTYGLMDNLTYAYSGNKLTKVTDAVTASITNPDVFHFVDGANVANEYTYDANGNITKDLNKNITSIAYNSLNLPSVITFGNGNTATYVYDGAGNKLSVAYNTGGTTAKTEYAGNKVYKNGTLSMILTEEGYITLSGTTPTYYYYLKDHQGNNRVVINQGGTVQQVNHYYPFGGVFGEGLQTSKQRYKYNGKELDAELGLNMYDYGARHYDAAIGRWGQVDPLAEKYYGISAYAYVANNPVNIIDPDGKKLVYLIRVKNGLSVKLTYSKGNFHYDDGRIYSLSSGNYDRTANILLDQYRKILDSGDKILINQLLQLEKSDKIHYMEKVASDGKGSGVTKYYNGSYTLWNFSEKNKKEFEKSEGVTNSDFSTVSHEMRHQNDYEIDNTSDNQHPNSAKDPSEIRAVNNENRAREKENIPLRTTYGGIKIDPDLLKNPPNNRY